MSFPKDNLIIYLFITTLILQGNAGAEEKKDPYSCFKELNFECSAMESEKLLKSTKEKIKRLELYRILVLSYMALDQPAFAEDALKRMYRDIGSVDFPAEQLSPELRVMIERVLSAERMQKKSIETKKNKVIKEIKKPEVSAKLKQRAISINAGMVFLSGNDDVVFKPGFSYSGQFNIGKMGIYIFHKEHSARNEIFIVASTGAGIDYRLYKFKDYFVTEVGGGIEGFLTGEKDIRLGVNLFLSESIEYPLTQNIKLFLGLRPWILLTKPIVLNSSLIVSLYFEIYTGAMFKW